jgi:hypothetical protein
LISEPYKAVDKNGEPRCHAALQELATVVKFLASRGQKIDLWIAITDKFGWSDVAIAVGYRLEFQKPRRRGNRSRRP